jgi:solute carrier family 25 citrate transporter 1
MTGRQIIKRETPLSLYKGLGAVLTGIVPKMAIRFTSYEWFKQKLANPSTGAVSGQATFFGKTTLFLTHSPSSTSISHPCLQPDWPPA